VFLVGSLPIFLIAYASFTVSVEIIASWVLQNACQYLLLTAAHVMGRTACTCV
jgi:hypothetical protein